jgi:hypothetical protein
MLLPAHTAPCIPHSHGLVGRSSGQLQRTGSVAAGSEAAADLIRVGRVPAELIDTVGVALELNIFALKHPRSSTHIHSLQCSSQRATGFDESTVSAI